MNDIDDIITAARLWAEQKLALATVIDASGSAPRPRGGHMLIAGDGRFAGSISGGCVEYDVFAMAEQVLDGGPAQSRTFGTRDPEDWQPGLPCGGEITVLVQPVGSDGFDPSLFEQISDARARGERISLATDLETGLTSSGAQPSDFVNQYGPPRRLLIVGAVQIAQYLAVMARTAGFTVTINDPRERFLSPQRFPHFTLSDAWPDEAVAAFAPDSQSAVVTLSHDIKIDDPALIAALRASTGYIGALGSRANHGRRLDRLRDEGFDDADLARIDGPAGVEIGSKGPQEIALSIAAGVVKGLRAHAHG